MGTVSRIEEFKSRWLPTLVLVDLHEGAADPASASQSVFREALDNCRTALAFGRRFGFPVAFVRHVSPSRSFLTNNACPSWLSDILPARSDMIFERHLPSCYASGEFCQMARRGAPLVLAGIFGETSCLATLMDGYARKHSFTYLADASVSRGLDGIPAVDTHQKVLAMAALYAEVSTTSDWMDRMAPRINAAS
jgi:hypothetical protein